MEKYIKPEIKVVKFETYILCGSGLDTPVLPIDPDEENDQNRIIRYPSYSVWDEE